MCLLKEKFRTGLKKQKTHDCEGKTLSRLNSETEDAGKRAAAAAESPRWRAEWAGGGEAC